MQPQQYCLRWKYHHNNLQTMFGLLLESGSFCDVTLACEGKMLKAHRVVLSACSTFFNTILTTYGEKDPIIIMKDSKFDDVKCLVDFMYRGEINVDQCNLASLLKTAEDLHIKGLAEVTWRDEGSTSQQYQSDRKMKHNTTHISNASSVVCAELNESSDGSPAIKRKRGRPPIDEEYADGPKITSVSGYDESSGRSIVTTMMHDSDEAMEPDVAQWMDGNPEKHGFNEAYKDSDAVNENSDEEYIEPSITDTDPLDTTSCPVPTYLNRVIKQEDVESDKTNDVIDDEWSDVVKMNDYLTRGRRPQFWEEPFTKRVMDAIKSKDLEMKRAAEILGVSYGTLYGRYRDTYGCLKHPYRVRDMWSEQGPAEILGMLQRKIISLPHAAEMLNVPPISITSYLDTVKDWTQDTDNHNSWDNSDTNENSAVFSEKKPVDDKLDREVKLSKNITIRTSSPKNTVEGAEVKPSATLLDNHPDITIINLKREKNKSEKINNNSNLDSHVITDI